MSPYLCPKFLHVLLAIIAIGFNVLLVGGGLLVYSPMLKAQIAAL